MTDDPREPPVCFRPGALAPALDARGDNRNAIAKRDLERLYWLLTEELRGIDFAGPIWDVLCSTARHHTLIPAYLAAAVEDELAEHYPQHTAPRIFVEMIKRLTPAQTIAVIDAIERYHALPTDTPNKLQAVGLLR